MNLWWSNLATMLFCSKAFAIPELSPLSASDLEPESSLNCYFRLQSSEGEPGAVVLELKASSALIGVDNSRTRLVVTEADCKDDCVTPGTTGLRVLELLGERGSATLRKQVFCHRDSEVCAGLPEGAAILKISTSLGQAELTVWNNYCDI